MKFKSFIFALVACFLVSSCELTNAAKGGMIGGASGGALGAGVGLLVSKLAGTNTAKTTSIAAAAGVAVGATAGSLIGHKMDKAAKAAAALAEAELLEDKDGLNYVKVTFDSGILFNTGKSTLSAAAQQNLTKFVNEVLDTDMDVNIIGYTDNAPFKGCTAEQSAQKNVQLSLDRANAVSAYLQKAGATAAQITSVQGLGEANPVASNATAEGKAQNRRVEVYILPSKAMIEAANNGTLK
ncbi:MAG: OmpA family protein [Bacteroidales bacterium]|nr:OmpA family protein [Bacteroidales bacterium]